MRGSNRGKKYKSDCKGGEDCYDERHLCKIAGRRDTERIRELVKDAKFFTFQIS